MTEQSGGTKLDLRIDWSELDYFGHVNNVMFFKYIQSSRVHYWDAIGLRQYHLEQRIGPMLASCHCNFKAPLHFPGTIAIEAHTEFIGNTSFGFHHTIRDESGAIAAEVHDVMVMFDFVQNHKVSFPAWLRKAIETVEGKPYP